VTGGSHKTSFVRVQFTCVTRITTVLTDRNDALRGRIERSLLPLLFVVVPRIARGSGSTPQRSDCTSIRRNRVLSKPAPTAHSSNSFANTSPTTGAQLLHRTRLWAVSIPKRRNVQTNAIVGADSSWNRSPPENVPRCPACASNYSGVRRASTKRRYADQSASALHPSPRGRVLPTRRPAASADEPAERPL